MNRAHKIAAAVSLAVLVLCLLGSFMTRGVMENLPFLHGQKAGWNAIPLPYGIVDQRPWSTAKTLTALAASAEELQLAREAERLADHEVDQNFAQSLRQASRRDQGTDRRGIDFAAAGHRTAADSRRGAGTDRGFEGRGAGPVEDAAPASAGAVKPVGDDLEAAKAQLSLDQDELSDSHGRIGAGERRSSRGNSAGVIGARSGDEEVRPAGNRG